MSDLQEFGGYEKPDGLCPRCDSWGHFRDENGLRVRCDLKCPNSEIITDEYLRVLNAKRLRATASPQQNSNQSELKPITEADFDAVLARRHTR